jgi:hypothetical protein
MRFIDTVRPINDLIYLHHLGLCTRVWVVAEVQPSDITLIKHCRMRMVSHLNSRACEILLHVEVVLHLALFERYWVACSCLQNEAARV